MTRRILLVALLLALVAAFVVWSGTNGKTDAPDAFTHPPVAGRSIELPVLYSEYFATSGRCAGCHGHDLQRYSGIDAHGRDVNLADDWRSSLMANSARDPFFRAKMTHESLVNPAHGGNIEEGCLSCHAPLAVYEQRLLGRTPFVAAMLDSSVLGMDGVSCLACHMQDPESAARTFSGEMRFDSASVYGPYKKEDIMAHIMQYFVRFTPDRGEHIEDGRTCAACHTAITATLDLQGRPTGTSFFEQATWHEWKNSVYYTNGQNCRQCHMPRINDSIVLAAGYAFLKGKSPFGLHHLVGGNDYMVRMLRDNAGELGVTASTQQFDSTIARSLDLLRNRTLELDLSLVERTSDTAFLRVDLRNLAGHKFPSGFPSRRAILQLVALKGSGDTLFASGMLDGAHHVVGEDRDLEPHHQVILGEDQAQIYELVMGDVNGKVTTVLKHGFMPLKDNRLTPLGFSTSHPSYDTTLIAGEALSDPDHNHDASGKEGSGTDAVHYHVPLNGYGGPLMVKARVLFQPCPPRWNRSMFEHEAPLIDAFKRMAERAPGNATLVIADSLRIGARAPTVAKAGMGRAGMSDQRTRKSADGPTFGNGIGSGAMPSR